MKRRSSIPVAVAAAAALGLLLSPPVRELLLSRMSLHMNLQLPLLVLCGAGMVLPWRSTLARLLAPVNRVGLSGWLLGTGLFSVWMVPRALDAAVADPAVDAWKVASLLLAGGLLMLSWRPAGTVVQAFFVGNTVWMTVTVGLLVAQSPVRLCNAYLEDDQRLAGYGLTLLGIAAGAAWLWGLRLRRLAA
ncbi:MAG: hypothetical protein HEQ39_07420 [Rhizobacter sp.]